ncbi:MAG: hypothetical protein CTY28_08335 [Hyphomicrobium sp.]|nr:MAG: hypothetical protein CTY28_08335 [Hyphomicrobium sp.]
MSVQTRPIFTADWPPYAIAAHIIYWLASAVLLGACAAFYFQIVPAGKLALSLILWFVSLSIYGAAAACSGRHYTVFRVFYRKPINGWRARVNGIVCLLTAVSMFLLCGAIFLLR